MIPRATYRLQFHAGFRFEQGAALAGYLADLGVSHVYASPIATARKGSTHGYDVVDPTKINPELGGEDGLRAMAATLRAHGIGIILDIVPNHMAVGGADNAWWLDVLANGQASSFAPYFDIDWEPGDPALSGKLLAPFLGQPYGEALINGALRLEADGSAVIAHDTHRFPLRPQDQAALSTERDLLQRYDGRQPEGAARLHAVLERQHYRLAWWRTAADQINWRRFFDITELAGLRVEENRVFDAVHALPIRLFADGLIDGVRVDHVDGLADPPGYVRKLRSALDTGRDTPAYLVVEKILASDEALPKSWVADGTSGYDFMNEVSALLHDPAGEMALTDLWERTSGRSRDFRYEDHVARAEILERTFPGQLAAASRAFLKLARRASETRDITSGMIQRALIGLLVQFDAYRSYAGSCEDGGDRLRRAAAAARGNSPWGESGLPDHLVDWILSTRSNDDDARDAARRFEQLSAPLAAKAVEDTAFYRYGRLLSRNDVGFDPGRFAQTPDDFATRLSARTRDFPHAMLATATHDHKRGEDVRARLAVLSEFPLEWAALFDRLALHPAATVIDAGDCYQIVQTIVGAWPLGNMDASIPGRVQQWTQKALREAKLRSSWTQPDKLYERSCDTFINALFEDPSSYGLLSSFVRRIAPSGAVNGLVQTLLRYTVPGVPDCYQGTEFWDLSLVDPDNRRPVDYASRRSVSSWLDAAYLVRDWKDGRVKQALIAHALRLRKDYPAVFSAGLRPVEVTGQRSPNIFAFRRSAEDHELLVVVPLLSANGINEGDQITLSPQWLGDTAIHTRRGLVSAARLLSDAPVSAEVHPI